MDNCVLFLYNNSYNSYIIFVHCVFVILGTIIIIFYIRFPFSGLEFRVCRISKSTYSDAYQMLAKCFEFGYIIIYRNDRPGVLKEKRPLSKSLYIISIYTHTHLIVDAERFPRLAKIDLQPFQTNRVENTISGQI